jgi:predicted RNase H-like HicB family nuclease
MSPVAEATKEHRFVASDITPKVATERMPALPEIEWEQHKPGERLGVRVVLGPTEEEVLPVYVPALPGAASQGSNEQQALANIQEALAGLVASYRDAGQEVPWQEDTGECGIGETSKWIVVDVK